MIAKSFVIGRSRIGIFIRFALATIFLTICCSPPPSIYRRVGFTNEIIKKISIGIVEITGYESNAAESKVSEQFLTTGVKIIERARIGKILQEHGFQQTGYIDNSTAVEIGNIIGVPAIFIGNVSSPSETNVANLRDNTWNSYSVTFTGRIICVKTGEILLSGSASGKRGHPNYAMLDAINLFFGKIYESY